MTLEERVAILEHNAEYARTQGDCRGCLDFRQMADFADWLVVLKELKEQKEYEDAINRQKAEDYKAMVREYHKRKEAENDTGRSG